MTPWWSPESIRVAAQRLVHRPLSICWRVPTRRHSSRCVTTFLEQTRRSDCTTTLREENAEGFIESERMVGYAGTADRRKDSRDTMRIGAATSGKRAERDYRSARLRPCPPVVLADTNAHPLRVARGERAPMRTLIGRTQLAGERS